MRTGETVSAERRAPGLTIVIPALNEEDAIADVIERCLAERSAIMSAAGLSHVDIIVVSDGSTDRTAEIACGYDEVRTVIFERNRGYGAAIKAGFEEARSEIVGFLDADGTCNPSMFAPMCQRLQANGADIVLGSRLGSESRMPMTRRIGNRIFAFLLGVLANQTVTDSASGMRVMWKVSFDKLGPLPNALHFTPAMSARALLSGMRVVELPMSYSERVGESKLRAFKDGLQFLRAILESLLYFWPGRGFAIVGGLAILLGLSLAANPVEHYLSNASLQEWMIYRFIVCFLLGAIGAFSLSYYALASRMIEMGPEGSHPPTFWSSAAVGLFRGKAVLLIVPVLMAGAIVLVWPGIVEYMRESTVSLHWSRIVVAAFGVLLAFQISATHMMLRIIDLWLEPHAG